MTEKDRQDDSRAPGRDDLPRSGATRPLTGGYQGKAPTAGRRRPTEDGGWGRWTSEPTGRPDPKEVNMIPKILLAWLAAGFCLALWLGPRLHQSGERPL